MIVEAIWIGAFLMFAWVLAGLHWLGYRKWKRATAKVVGYKDDPNPTADDGGLRAAVFRFTPEGGAPIEAADKTFTNSRYRIGAKVKVVYPPADPGQARIEGHLYTMQLGLGAMGLVIFLVGLFGKG